MKHKMVLSMTSVLLVGILIGGIVEWKCGALYFSFGALSKHEGHDHSGEKSSQVTVWSGRYEIFLEHPYIVADTPTRFVTHVSDLVTLEPRRKGPVTFILSHASETPIEHIEPAPARDGIYIPELTFPIPGQWDISLVIPLEGKDYLVELPEFRVYGSRQEVDRAPFPEEIAGISFLKEQQWKIPTKTEPVRQRAVLEKKALAVRESALIDEDGKPVAFVQIAGETFEKRYPELGNRDRGYVEISSGLSEGEHVVTRGAYAVAKAEHQGHIHECAVRFTEDDIERFGIEVGTAGPGKIDVRVSLPGQIAINTDRMAHIVPNATGMVRQVFKNVGDTVKAGEVLAWLESAELGKAKVDYLTKLAEVGCCSIDLARTQQVHDSTMKLLETLQLAPSLETLSQISDAALDKNHTTLISSYAEFMLAKSAYLREKSLFEGKISSERDYLAAENEFKKAEAKYAASRDSITFEVQKSLIDAQRDQQVRLIGLKGAERNLYILGLTAEDINDVRLLAQDQSSTDGHEEVCTDPNCPECAKRSTGHARSGATDAHEEACTDPNCTECAKHSGQNAQSAAAESGTDNQRLAWYPLRAPFDATVIEKHITLGEKLSGDSSAFTVADLSTVWIDLNVYQKDLPFVKEGQCVEIVAGPATPKVEGKISYVGPVVGEKTRTALARIVLDNTCGLLRPGTFVTADVLVKKIAADVVVAKSTLQDVDDRPSVFVQDEHGFEPRAVTLGSSDDDYVEITSGLQPGERIVTKNSFRLKAELKKARGAAHAGHGHAH